MRIRDVISNYGGLVASLTLPLAVNFVLANYLSPEHFGIISLLSVMIAVAGVVDFGVSRTLGRLLLVARNAGKTAHSPATITMTYVSLSWIMSFAASVAVACIFWSTLQSARTNMGIGVVDFDMMIIFVCVFGFSQLAKNSIFAVLNSSGLQTIANLTSITIVFVRSIACISFAFSIQSDALIYIVGILAIGSAAELAVLSLLAWSKTPGLAASRIDLGLFLDNLRFTASDGLTAICGVLVSFGDRMVAIHLMPLGVFGAYALLSQIVQIAGRIVTPVVTASFPDLVKVMQTDYRQKGGSTRLVSLRILLIVGSVAGIALVPCGLFAPDIIFAIAGALPIPPSMRILAAVISLSTLVNLIIQCVHILFIAEGRAGKPLLVGVIQSVVYLIGLVVSVKLVGVLGAAIMALLSNVLALAMLLYFLDPQVRRDFVVSTKVIVAPLVACLAVGVLLRWALPLADNRPVVVLHLAAVGILLTAVVLIGLFLRRTIVFAKVVDP